MPKRDWLQHVALGLAALCLLLLLGLALYLPESPLSVRKSDHQTKAEQEKAQHYAAANEANYWLRAVQERRKPPTTCGDSNETPNCSEQYSTALDLSAQWLAAKAADKVAFWTLIQTGIGVVGLFGLAATVIYTHRTLRQAEKTSHAQLRPYIYVKSCLFQHDPTGQYPMAVHVMLKNYGVTPAIDASSKVEKRLAQRDAKKIIQKFSERAETNSNFHIPPGQEMTLRIDFSDAMPPASWSQHRQKKEIGLVWGVVSYEDHAGGDYTLEFQMFHVFGNMADFGICDVGNRAT